MRLTSSFFKMMAMLAFTLLLIFLSTDQGKAQSPPPSIKRAIDKLLNPETGNEALQQSCIRISINLKAYIQAKLNKEIEFSKILKDFDTQKKLSDKINQLDNPNRIDDFIIYSAAYLIKFPNDPNYAERLWKLAAIVDLREENGKCKLLTERFFPALINACSQLPPDNTFNLEGRFLLARYHERKREFQKQEEILNEILKRSKISLEARYTAIGELGKLKESQELFTDALKLYASTKDGIDSYPQPIDFILRSAIIHLELGQNREAIQKLLSLKDTKPSLRKVTSSPKALETLLSLSSNENQLSLYWKHSKTWWPKWLNFRNATGVKLDIKDLRIPNFTESGKIQKNIAQSIATNDKILFYDQLDLLMHRLRWCPSSLNQVGTTLCFLLPQIQNNLQKDIHELLMIICDGTFSGNKEFYRRSKLYKTISFSVINDHNNAIKNIKSFLDEDAENDEVTETIIRLWAHLAINGKTETHGPKSALENLLYSNKKLSNRPQTVLSLAQIYRKIEDYIKEEQLLSKEVKEPKVRSDQQIHQTLTSRLNEIRSGIVTNNEFTKAILDWFQSHSPEWLNFTLPEGFNDARLKNISIEKALSNPSLFKISREEHLKLHVLVASSKQYPRVLREDSFQRAFTEIYSSCDKYSTARKMLRDLISDDRFPQQLIQLLLVFSMDEALTMSRKRDITHAITHPLLDRKNSRIASAIQTYGSFASTDLSSSESLSQCYQNTSSRILDASSFAVIAQIFERSLSIGSLDLAERIFNESPSWKVPNQLRQRQEILISAIENSLQRAKASVPFGKSMHRLITALYPDSSPNEIIDISKYKQSVDLKRLTEKDAFNLLLKRALSDNIIESSPRFWFDLAELMPRDHTQVRFSFQLIENLMLSKIPDLEKSFSLFSSPSIIDTDDKGLREKLFEIFKKHRNKDKEPFSYAATIITQTQAGDIRLGRPVNIDQAWNGLKHPVLENILIPTKLGILMAHKNVEQLKETLLNISDDQLFSSNLLDVSWPALIMSELSDKTKTAEEFAKKSTSQSIAKAARYLDFQSIRFIYDSANRLNDKSIIPEGWFKYLDSQIKSERDSYSLRIINAEYEENWEELAKWSGRAVTEYPTYYNYYRPRGYALAKLGKTQEAIAALNIYIKYSKDEVHWKDALTLLNSLKTNTKNQ
ncbi:MAG: hypothetical protein EVB09_02780 [Verrucomicrobiaceae bacterium]|nr:MAG: hypothetical protein EVB09_02780 [Verrucomicrobiaceae bacterium]